MLSFVQPEFIIERDDDKCIRCLVCVRQCSFETHKYDEELDRIVSDNTKCVGCQRCVILCPTKALTVKNNPLTLKENAYWTPTTIMNIYKQAETGGSY